MNVSPEQYGICTEYYSVIDDRIVSIYIYIYSKGALCIVRSSHLPGNVLGKKKRGRAGGRGKREAKIRTTDRWAPQAI
jgi:hypothetical protein